MGQNVLNDLCGASTGPDEGHRFTLALDLIFLTFQLFDHVLDNLFRTFAVKLIGDKDSFVDANLIRSKVKGVKCSLVLTCFIAQTV